MALFTVSVVGNTVSRLPRLLRDVRTHRIEGVLPPGFGQIGQDLGAIRQMHEGSSGARLFEVAISEFHQPRVLLVAFPPRFFQPPENAFRR